MNVEKEETLNSKPREVYIVGGGIAALATAALLIRDGGVPGERIHVLEESDRLGGSLDGGGSADAGYVIRGGRMFEQHFGCTYDLFDTIPTLTNPDVSVTQEIHEFTRRVVTSSKSRLVSDGRKIEAPEFELSLQDKWDLAKLALRSEGSLKTMRIEEYFSEHFFTTNFWMMWCTMFAFQPWHSVAEMRRYMRRFIHLLPGFNRLEGIFRTVYNQYDSLVLPLFRWLEERGVQFRFNVQVTDVDFESEGEGRFVTGLHALSKGRPERFDISPDDKVFITLGSMTEGSSLGSMSSAPVLNERPSGAWSLWKNIAAKSDDFGVPDVFCEHVPQTKWESFTVTLRNSGYFEFMEDFTGNPAGTGGLVTFKDSRWRMSVVLAYQPHFINQPESIQVFWGYGLFPDERGDFVDKKMSECNGAEILSELAGHLRLGERTETFFRDANCIPCMMPFVTSQFMPRSRGDRPAVVPEGAANFAFLGQFCEMPNDVVFTVEYSVRTAQRAVYKLLQLPKQETPLYRGYRKRAVLLRALKAMDR